MFKKRVRERERKYNERALLNVNMQYCNRTIRPERHFNIHIRFLERWRGRGRERGV